MSTLLSLPRELRDQIYDSLFAIPFVDISGRILKGPVVLDVKAHIPPHGKSSKIPFSILPPLGKSCKQLYWESTPNYLSSNVLLHISSETTAQFLHDWFSTFEYSGTIFSVIQHVELSDPKLSLESWQVGLLRVCPSLRTLNLEFALKRVDIVPSSVDQRRCDHLTGEREQIHPNPRLQKLIDTFNLDVIFRLTKLENLSVRVTEEGGHVQRDLSEELRDWLEQGWEKSGRGWGTEAKVLITW